MRDVGARGLLEVLRGAHGDCDAGEDHHQAEHLAALAFPLCWIAGKELNLNVRCLCHRQARASCGRLSERQIKYYKYCPHDISRRCEDFDILAHPACFQGIRRCLSYVFGFFIQFTLNSTASRGGSQLEPRKASFNS